MKIDKKILGWSLYDWANSAFATTVLAGFFPVFLKEYWYLKDGVKIDVPPSSVLLGNASSIVSLIIAVSAPILGAIADKTTIKKKLLIFFAFIGAIMTGALALVHKGNWQMAILFFTVASIGWSGGNIFYDSTLIAVAGKDEKKCDDVSALGFSLGYIGGGLLFLINVIMFKVPGFFGIANSTEAIKVSFISVGVWWMVFSIPLILFVKEPEVKENLPIVKAVKEGILQLWRTFLEIRKLKVIGTFLLAYFIYIDGVGSIIKMAVSYGADLGFNPGSLIVALLITQFVAFPATLGFNYMGSKIGIKKALYVAILSYSVFTLAGLFMQNETHFYILAVCIGMFQGGIQSASRSYFTRLIPKDKAGEYFGFYNVLGKGNAIIGPFFMALITRLTGNVRIGMGSILILFLLGYVLLKRVDTEEGKKLAEKL